MKRVSLKVLLIIMIFLLIGIAVPKKTFAAETIDATSIIDAMKEVNEVTDDDTKVGKVLNGIIKLIQYAGTGISIITVTWLGIKYMVASANEKADLKKQGIPIVIGCVLLFGASNLVGIIADLGNDLN